MDYSLLVGIHDMDKYDLDIQEEAEKASEENGDAEEEEEGEDSGSGECLTPPDSPEITPRTRHVMIEEYDPSIDVYAVKGFESKSKMSMVVQSLLHKGDSDKQYSRYCIKGTLINSTVATA